MTEPGKNAPGLVGFPTPNEAADISSYLLFYFPDEAWAQYILGALEPMTAGYNWYEAGSMSPDEAAEAFRIIIQQAPYNLLDPTVPTPWWDEDSADDTDDEAPKEDQPWYGQIVIIDDNLTFVENAFIWVVAGFIAYAGLPGAALSFVPIAQKFVVTVKSNPLGGIIRFFADAVAIGEVDTYSPTDAATDVPLMLPEGMGFRAETAPVFWAELLPDNPHGLESVSATIVRSRLSERDFSPGSLRYNSDCDCVQYTPDGGETWIDDPGDDPRVGTKFIKPLKTGSDIRCRSAASMVKWLRDFIEYEAGLLTAGAEITALANAGLALFDILAPWAILANLVIDVAGTLFGIGAAALNTAFDEETWGLLLCIFYCNMAADGSISDSQYAEIQTQITAQLNTTAALVLNLIISTQGRVGLQNAGVLYEVEDPDCSACECEWCYEWDFTISDGGWAARTGFGITVGHYAAGVGWQPDVHEDGCSQHAYTYLYKTLGFTADNIASVEYTFASAIGDFDILFFDQNDSGHGIVQRTSLANGVATVHGADMTPVSCQIIEITVNKCGAPSGWTQTKCRVKGFGDMPAFTGGSICS
jgi:hypothetical protein